MYYPFVKIYDKNELAKEHALEQEKTETEELVSTTVVESKS